ncbi:MAG TPA: hypothetical protein P5137_11680, partial [Candidatus Brocadiia bacterium]|nr:hypothetical protein [Candidatus Brocadiia bacterium]
MRKLLFFDCREIESIRNFERVLQPAVKCRRNPLLIADRPWENGNFTLYGSVIKVPGKPFQLWYSVIHKPWYIYLCYAESEDGLQWTRPLYDIVKHKGRKTNIVLDGDVHGPAVIHDPADPNPNRRYKLAAGLAPSGCIHICHSPDGVHWTRATRFPVIGTNPDCPMAFFRMNNGRYAAHHRVYGLGRRVCRSESWDLLNWSEPRMVMEPDAGDPPQVQFYGMGAATYGDYEIGTLWMFHTDPDEPGFGKMKGYQETELAYARSGFAWHRLAQGTPFIPHGRKGQWDQGCLQCASQPVFLEDEIRFYYAGTDAFHSTRWELT